jgi:hypothetical protein
MNEINIQFAEHYHLCGVEVDPWLQDEPSKKGRGERVQHRTVLCYSAELLSRPIPLFHRWEQHTPLGRESGFAPLSFFTSLTPSLLSAIYPISTALGTLYRPHSLF